MTIESVVFSVWFFVVFFLFFFCGYSRISTKCTWMVNEDACLHFIWLNSPCHPPCLLQFVSVTWNANIHRCNTLLHLPPLRPEVMKPNGNNYTEMTKSLCWSIVCQLKRRRQWDVQGFFFFILITSCDFYLNIDLSFAYSHCCCVPRFMLLSY